MSINHRRLFSSAIITVDDGVSEDDHLVTSYGIKTYVDTAVSGKKSYAHSVLIEGACTYYGGGDPYESSYNITLSLCSSSNTAISTLADLKTIIGKCGVAVANGSYVDNADHIGYALNTHLNESTLCAFVIYNTEDVPGIEHNTSLETHSSETEEGDPDEVEYEITITDTVSEI